MQRSSKYYALQWIVECCPAGQAFFESIAAFNAKEIAKDYAIDCYNFKQRRLGASQQYKYRVVERRGVTFKVIANHPSNLP